MHFSHFYASPLTLNPALTGYFNGCWRIGGNYRNQWQSITVPYRTFSAYVDGVPLTDVGPIGRLALGGLVLQDRAGDGNLSTTKAFFSIALHKAFGLAGNVAISIGAGGGLVQKKLDFSQLVFDEQWNGAFFDPSLSANEPTRELSYMDLHGGAVLTVNTRAGNFYAGFSMAHIITPDETFLSSSNALGMRPVIHAGGFVPISSELTAEPSLLYMQQKKAQEILFGSNFGWSGFQRIDRLIGGVWFRGTGDAIPVLGAEYKGARLLMSYDVNVSSLKEASNLRGGIEMSLSYVLGCADKKAPGEIVVPCLRF